MSIYVGIEIAMIRNSGEYVHRKVNWEDEQGETSNQNYDYNFI